MHNTEIDMYSSDIDKILEFCPEKCGSRALNIYGDWDELLFAEVTDKDAHSQRLEILLCEAVSVIRCFTIHIAEMDDNAK